MREGAHFCRLREGRYQIGASPSPSHRAQMRLRVRCLHCHIDEFTPLGVQIMQAHPQIIERIVDSARALQGVLPSEPQRLSPRSLVEQSVGLARRALGASAPSISIEVRHDASPWHLEVDAARLERAIANLIVNAAKHTAPSEPIVVLAHVDAAGAEVRVTHAGGGLNPRALAATPGDAGRRTPELDLHIALARQAIELQGGSLVLRAAASAQPSVVIRLPARAVRKSGHEAQTFRAAPAARPRIDGVHVLLVEDDPDALDLLALILRQAGAKVSPYALAAPAFDYFVGCETPPDIVVSDIAMPVEDGYSFLSRLRAWERRRGRVPVPAVAVSAFGRDEDVQRALAHGFDRHIAKPVDASRLIEVIASWTHPRQ